ncbi:MAG: hypothetical protein AB1609_01990 [Bacillota bacterium]
MSSVTSPQRPGGGGRSGAWWLRWVAILGGAGVFSWALAAILNGGAPAGRAGEGATADRQRPLEPPARREEFGFRDGGFAGGFGDWEPEREDDPPREAFWDREDEDDGDDGWEEEHGAAFEFGFARPAPSRRAPDARSRPS